MTDEDNYNTYQIMSDLKKTLVSDLNSHMRRIHDQLLDTPNISTATCTVSASELVFLSRVRTFIVNYKEK